MYPTSSLPVVMAITSAWIFGGATNAIDEIKLWSTHSHTHSRHDVYKLFLLDVPRIIFGFPATEIFPPWSLLNARTRKSASPGLCGISPAWIHPTPSTTSPIANSAPLPSINKVTIPEIGVTTPMLVTWIIWARARNRGGFTAFWNRSRRSSFGASGCWNRLINATRNWINAGVDPITARIFPSDSLVAAWPPQATPIKTMDRKAHVSATFLLNRKAVAANAPEATIEKSINNSASTTDSSDKPIEIDVNSTKAMNRPRIPSRTTKEWSS